MREKEWCGVVWCGLFDFYFFDGENKKNKKDCVVLLRGVSMFLLCSCCWRLCRERNNGMGQSDRKRKNGFLLYFNSRIDT